MYNPFMKNVPTINFNPPLPINLITENGKAAKPVKITTLHFYKPTRNKFWKYDLVVKAGELELYYLHDQNDWLFYEAAKRLIPFIEKYNAKYEIMTEGEMLKFRKVVKSREAYSDIEVNFHLEL